MTVAEALAEGGGAAEQPATDDELAGIPDSPLKIEAGEIFRGKAGEEYHFSLSRTLYSRNGVPFVYAVEGETYASIAKSNHLLLREILKFNDLPGSAELHAGDVVYLEPKKTRTVRGLDKYIVGEEGESFHAICQRFAVKEKAIRKLNGLPANYQPKEGDELVLRPESKIKKLWKKR
jgi:LysM repeat protein